MRRYSPHRIVQGFIGFAVLASGFWIAYNTSSGWATIGIMAASVIGCGMIASATKLRW